MGYFDEQIIEQLSAHKKGVQGDIENGMYIREELYQFQKTELFEKKMSIMLPESFVDMPLERAKLKYPMEQRPQIIKMNETGDINFTFSFVEQQMKDNQVEQIMQLFKRAIKNAQPSNVFHEECVEQINGSTVGWFDYVSNVYFLWIYYGIAG